MAIKDMMQKMKEWKEKGLKSYYLWKDTVSVSIYSKPNSYGFLQKKGWLEENKILFTDLEDVEIHTLVGIPDDHELYVITSVLEASSKTVEKEGKQYTYSYYPAEYAILNDVFSEEVSGLVQSELTDRQKEILAELKQELENQSTIFKTKKEIGLILYNYFYECVQYRLKNHYLVRAFSRLVQDGIQDYTEKVLLLFE